MQEYNFSKLTWILQDKAIAPFDLETLERAIHDTGCSVKKLQIVPFQHVPVGTPPNITGPCIVYGSSGLLKVARSQSWLPGGWDGPAFNASVMNHKLGALSLNSQAVLTEFSEVYRVARDAGWEQVFVRPDAESKEFPGRLFSLEALASWNAQLIRTEYFAEQDNAALVAPHMPIGREWRCFVVDNEVVSCSQYAEQGVPRAKEGAPQNVVEFVTDVIAVYQPAPCFVLDIAELPDENPVEFRVVEFNSINSAGFYKCSIGEIVNKVSKYVLKNT